MRIASIWVVGAWLFVTSPVFADPPPQAESPQLTQDRLSAAAPPTAVPAAGSGPSNVPVYDPALTDFTSDPTPFPFWLRAEYLAYWVKKTPQSVSLVTGDPSNPTQELLPGDRDFGMFSGFRVGIGSWLNFDRTIGIETSLFSLQRRTQNFSASSDNAGNPTLAFPFINQTPGAVGDTLMPITAPGQFAGDVLVASTLQLWGTEANGVLSLIRQGGFEFTALAGFRYIDLQENLNISTFSNTLATNPSAFLAQVDQFNTRNQFYGGQVGGRVNWKGEYFVLDVTGKLALGDVHQTVDIQGASAQFGPGVVNGTFPGGFFTQPTNIGRYTANQVTLIPSVETKLFGIISPRLRAFIGYDFLYWAQVVRPGNQVDRNINLSQSAVFGNGVLSGPAYPTAPLSRTDFWAQGMTFGFEFRF